MWEKVDSQWRYQLPWRGLCHYTSPPLITPHYTTSTPHHIMWDKVDSQWRHQLPWLGLCHHTSPPLITPHYTTSTPHHIMWDKVDSQWRCQSPLSGSCCRRGGPCSTPQWAAHQPSGWGVLHGLQPKACHAHPHPHSHSEHLQQANTSWTTRHLLCVGLVHFTVRRWGMHYAMFNKLHTLS